MLKVILIALGLSVATSAFAQSVLRLSAFATQDSSKITFSKMIKTMICPHGAVRVVRDLKLKK